MAKFKCRNIPDQEIDYDKKLKEIIVYAYTHSPFYKWFYKRHNIDVHSIRGLKDYDSLPILRKEDIFSFAKESGVEELWCIHDYKDLKVVTTTGSTGKRLKVPFTQTDIYRFTQEPCTDCLYWWGYEGGPINVIIWGHSPDSTVALGLNSIAKKTGGKAYLAEEVEKNTFERMAIKNETLTYTNLPSLLKFIDSPFRRQIFEEVNLKYIFTLVSPSEVKTRLHTKIKAELGNINLIPCYGSTEALFVGASCPYTFEDTYVHITQPGLFHIVEHNGSLCDEGKGELLYTSLGREAFPFIKYSTGDIVTLKKEHGCGCGYLGWNLRFETRRLLTIKIQYADGYFIDIVKVAEIIKEIIPGSQVMCVYGEHPHQHYLFLAIFIGVSKSITEDERQLKDKIIENIILDHVPSEKINGVGLSNLLAEWRPIFPIFLVDVDDIPIESGANKPKLLLNLMDEEKLLKSNRYQNILSRIEGYWFRR